MKDKQKVLKQRSSKVAPRFSGYHSKQAKICYLRANFLVDFFLLCLWPEAEVVMVDTTLIKISFNDFSSQKLLVSCFGKNGMSCVGALRFKGILKVRFCVLIFDGVDSLMALVLSYRIHPSKFMQFNNLFSFKSFHSFELFWVLL